ncbi:MAG TPA: transcriptional regulator [Noviherbaspirillum sp.]|jgi:y4mF family transcriptional regulator|uniref:transcriptional regulator n=1 Tax=Noviherbaspirillum sp. TaxID=1926288 RepID=UPI002F940617
MAKNLPTGKEASLPAAVPSTEALGRLVQGVRKQQGMTQFDVAGLAGCGNRFIVDLEKGKETIQMQKALDVLALLGLEVVIRRKGAA